MKRTIVIAIDAALVALVATGCAVHKPAPPQVTPVLEIRHSGINADGYYQLGRFLQLQQRHAEAAEAYLKAVALDPRNVGAHNGLGTLLALRSRYDDAHREFDAALVLAPDNAAVLNNIGYAYLLEHRMDDAAVAFQRAAAIDPDNARYQANLELVTKNQPPESAQAEALAAATHDTFDAVPAPQQAESFPVAVASEAEAVRLVSIGPNAFELVIPPPRSGATVAAALPPSGGAVGVEVSNGNGATGMARRVGQQLARAGVAVKRLTNHTPYGAVTTYVEYRPGHERAAVDLSWRLPGRPPVTASSSLRSGIDVRLVLGRELPVDVALLSPGQQLASNAAGPSAQ
jgi:Tfp pilus assembly protein PilF